MRPILALLAACLLAPAALAEDPAPENAPAVVNLRDAVSRGLVSAQGVDPSSYQQVTLKLRSRASERIVVDLCGGYLKPRRRCQRLGLGPEVTPHLTSRGKDGGILVSLEPGEAKELRLLTVCLDAGLPAPSGDVFEPATDRLPEVREKVLAWWAEHPDAPQGAVNAAIWQFRPTVQVGPGVVEGYRTPKGLFGVLLGGSAYRLKDGELLSFGVDDIVRFLGTELFQALPTEDGLYAIGLGEDRKPELWRLALTGEEPWGRVMDLDLTDRVREVFTAAPGRLVLVTDHGVRIVDTAKGETIRALDGERILDLTTRRPGSDRLTVVLRVPAEAGFYQGGERKGEKQDVFELWTVDLRTGAAEQVKRYWNVRSAAAGAAGVFGLTHRGGLRRLVGSDFRGLPAPEDYDRILAVGRNLVWLATPENRLAAVSARTGARLFLPDVKVDGSTAVSLDPVTDDLAVVSGSHFLRVRARDGSVEEVGIP